MEAISIEQLVDITKGTLIQPAEATAVTGAVIDSRNVVEGDLFIPIKGERVDGHQFIIAAAASGAAATLTEKKLDQMPKGLGIIQVESCLEAMKAIATYNRSRYDIPVIAVTGSSGKTTTKDLIAAVLSAQFRVMKTQGNFNNEYGVPQTLFRLESSHEMAVVEMGMDSLGDISKSVWEVRPHIAAITNIGTAHIENLKTQDNILKAKSEIFETMSEDDIALLNGDDAYLNKINEEAVPFKVVRVGINSDKVDLKARNVQSSANGICFDADGDTYHFAYPGIHNVYNCLMGIWIGKYYGMSAEAIQRGLDAFHPSSNRMDMFEIDGMKIINDTYNANPDAMQAALSVLSDVAGDGRKIAVLGDMLEMGDEAQKAHEAIGEIAGEIVDVLVAVGTDAIHYVHGAEKYLGVSACYHVQDAQSAASLLTEICIPGDTLLIKASRGMQLDKTVEYLKNNIKKKKEEINE